MNVTQRALAKKCGLSPAYVANLERNVSEPPPLKTCKLLARALGVGWEEMWQRSFASRLRRWLKREGFSGMPETDLHEIAKNIKAKSK